MTVIAYSKKHETLASDSRCTDAYLMHLTTCTKVERLKSGALLGSAGDADGRDLHTLLEKATPRKMPSRQELAELKMEAAAILVFPKGEVFVVTVEYVERDGDGNQWDAQVVEIHDDFVAIGCGQQFAYGALEAGKSPVEAVRITCKRDVRCSLPVQWKKLR